MKCISLWQPWASLIAHGMKKVETRGWATAHRGQLAIHAAKRWTVDEKETLDYFRSMYGPLPAALPLGAIVAVVELVACRVMDQTWIDAQTQRERDMGAWAPGRVGWVLDKVRPIEPAVPIRGHQYLFDVTEADVGAAAWQRLHGR